MRKEKKSRAPAVVYDPDAHREFVTGFRSRKQARRQQAAESAASAEKDARRQLRKEKREVLREAAEKSRGAFDDSDDDVKADEICREETTYQTDDTVVTAVVAPLETAIDKKVVEKESIASSSKSRESVEGKAKKSLLAKAKNVQATSRKRRISYTHTLSKLSKRKLKLKKRKAERK